MARRVFKYQIPGTRILVSLDRLKDTLVRYQRLEEQYHNDRPFANALHFAGELLGAFIKATYGAQTHEVRNSWMRYAQHHNETLRGMINRRKAY